MRFFTILTFALALSSCKKFVDPGKPTVQLDRPAVFANDGTATAAMLAVYAQLESGAVLGNLVTYTGLTSDEFALNSTAPLFVELHTNNISPGNSFPDFLWQRFYFFAYQCNAILEGLQASANLSPAVKQQLEGEARFARAYCYFNLVNLYGDVPLATGTDYNVNARLGRNPKAEVFDFIIADLESAKLLLVNEYKSPANASTAERTRPNRFAALALLSKAYLYKEDFAKAISAAGEVIAMNTMYELPSNLVTNFQKGSKEHIWQIQPVLASFNTYLGYQMILTGAPASVHLNKSFLQIFEAADKRRSAWIGMIKTSSDSFYFAHKYKAGINTGSITEYTSMLRLAEVILIRSEALAREGKITEAESDLNKLRQRAGINSVSGLSQQQLIDSIAMERRRELFAENASRWYDLKRTGTINTVLGAVKGVNWAATDALYPLPVTELQRNSLLQQNPGY
jgi:starch-binding outer membrane protein, SusD/RagB family